MKESDEVYHGQNIMNGGQYLSSHALIEYMNCPAAFDQKMRGLIPPKDSDSFKAGRAAHCLILEGKAEYQRRYVFGGPINEKTGKPYGQTSDKYKQWVADQEGEVITDAIDRDCQYMAAGVKMHVKACEDLSLGRPEVIARAKYCGQDCQIKIDWLRTDKIIDLKTCRDLNWFHKDFFDYQYDNQLSFYQKVYEQDAGARLPVYVLAVQKTAPYMAAYYKINQSILDHAQLENEKAMHEMRKSLELGLYPTGFEGVRELGGKK